MKTIYRQKMVYIVKPTAGLAVLCLLLIILFSFLPSAQTFQPINDAEFNEIQTHDLNLLFSALPGNESLKQAQKLRRTLPGLSLELERYHLLCLHNSAQMVEFEKYAWAFLMVTDDALIAYLLNQVLISKGELKKRQILEKFRPAASAKNLLFYLDQHRFWILFWLWSIFLTGLLVVVWLKIDNLEKVAVFFRSANASIRELSKQVTIINQPFETISPVGLKKLNCHFEPALQKSESTLITLHSPVLFKINADFLESGNPPNFDNLAKLASPKLEMLTGVWEETVEPAEQTGTESPDRFKQLGEMTDDENSFICFLEDSVRSSAFFQLAYGNGEESAIEDYDPIFTFRNPAIPGYYNFSRPRPLGEAKMLVTKTMMSFEKEEISQSENDLGALHQEKKTEEAKFNIVEAPESINYLNSDAVILPSNFNAEAIARPYYQENSPIFENLATNIMNSSADQIIGITSGSAISNRAAFTVMLGKTINKNGKKVLLFDLDFEDLKLNQLTRDPCIYSLKDYLKTGIFNDEITIKSLIDNIFILHPGTGDGKSHQAMNSPGFWHEVLRLASNRFDYIIINLPDLFRLSNLNLHKEEIVYLVMIDENSASSRFEFLDLMIPLRNYNFNQFKPVNCRHSR
ncbi:MAG: hypothetical protein ACOYXC_20975 [Candidatus Rifleibacteriota bacterium]